MKRVIMILAVLLTTLTVFSQNRILSVNDYVVSEALKEVLSQSQIEKMRTEDPVTLLTMNRTIEAYSLVIYKLWDEDFVQMGYLEDYLPAGMKYSEDQIIEASFINPYKWKLPQNDTKYNLFKLRKSGVYVVVMPKDELEERVNAHLRQYGLTK